MKNRQFILFTILVALAILAIIFVFFYRYWTNISLKDYLATITICGNILDENDCFAKDFCEGIYGPTESDSNQLDFKRCQRLPIPALIEIEQEKNLCQTTGGQWYRNKLGNFCLCEKAGLGKVFDKQKGCVGK
ncbi:MAG TPA: hypothetical protein VJG65_02840 [Patescibacteria group bacterium]|nr:hypothetical protein [Patescibacteria group bacterium]